MFLLCFFKITNAQEAIPEFGAVDMSELTMKECSFEKTATFMNLIKTAKISFDIAALSGVPKISTEYRVRIKIFNEKGFSAANIKIPYISKSKSTKIIDIDAYIYYLDQTGKIIREKVESNEIYQDKSRAKNALNYISFTFPNLKVGVVIEYRYTRVDKNSIGIRPWFFQDEVPTSVSKVTAMTPEYLRMDYHLLALDKIERDSSKEMRSFTLRNIHSFKPEPFMTPLKDNLQRVEFALAVPSVIDVFSNPDARLGTYNFFLLNSPFFGFQFYRPIVGADKFIDSVRKLKDIDDRIACAYAYIKKNIEWNGEQTFFCDSMYECWKNKSGSSAEMNIYFLDLLRKVDISCYPVLISTRDNGNPDPDFASFSQFDGVDIMVMNNSTRYIIDCTQKNLSFKMPPLNILNSYGYIIDQKIYGWLFIVDPRILRKNDVSINGEMDSLGNIHGTASFRSIGFAKTQTLQDLKKKNDLSKSDDNETINNVADLLMDSLIMEHDHDDVDTLVQKANFHLTLSNSGKSYFLNPNMFSTFRKNPFKDSERFSDIDFGCNQSFDVRIDIKVPIGISVESIPENISFSKLDSNILFERKISVENSTLTIHSLFVLKNAVFNKGDYPDLKSFFDKFYSSLSEEILFKKNG